MCTDADAVSVAQIVPSACLHLVYFASFFSPWVITGSRTWSLWSRCYKEEVYDAVKNTTHETKCQHIQPGDSPAYFEIVRTFACLTFVLFVMSSVACCKFNAERNRCTVKVVFILLTSICAGITLTVFGLMYDEDDRWKDSNPSLDLGFWLGVSAAVLNLSLLGCNLFCKFEDNARVAPRVQNRPPLPAPPARRLSNASTMSLKVAWLKEGSVLTMDRHRSFTFLISSLGFPFYDNLDTPTHIHPSLEEGEKQGRG